MKSLLLLLLPVAMFAQTVPPAPTIQPVQNPLPLNVHVISNAPQCLYGATACGLSDCGCWIQLYYAQCTSATQCPALSTSAPFQMPSSIPNTLTPDGSGGTNYDLNDQNPALLAGTTWIYFETVNYAQYSPWTPSPWSNPVTVTIPGGASLPVSFKVQLDFDNLSCVTGNNCAVQVYRATCTTTGTCPVYAGNPAAFTKLADNSTQTVTAAKTHFTALDTGAAPNGLQYNQPYAYAVTNSFLAYPSNPSSSAQITLVTPTGSHNAILNWSNPSCRVQSQCSLQVYRATCTGTCPAYSQGSSAWKALNMSSGLIPTTGAQGTTWQYTDADAALSGGTTYAWVATNQYNGASTVSAASAPFVGTTAP